jgi:hypothetical protein
VRSAARVDDWPDGGKLIMSGGVSAAAALKTRIPATCTTTPVVWMAVAASLATTGYFGQIRL